jgi:hypothetical protein
VLIEEESVLGGKVFMRLENDTLLVDGEELVELFYWKFL